MSKEFSKYKISWLILLPIKGKATKRDVALLNKKSKLSGFGIIGLNGYMAAKHFSSKSDAEKELKTLKGLGKPYSAFIITDAQFGKMEIDYIKGTNKLLVTKKQIKARKIVK